MKSSLRYMAAAPMEIGGNTELEKMVKISLKEVK